GGDLRCPVAAAHRPCGPPTWRLRPGSFRSTAQAGHVFRTYDPRTPPERSADNGASAMVGSCVPDRGSLGTRGWRCYRSATTPPRGALIHGDRPTVRPLQFRADGSPRITVDWP